MEHLIPTSQSAPIRIEAISAPLYDGGDFSSYPERNGWDFALWQAEDAFTEPSHLREWLLYNGRGIDELPAFLQTWLFFGLLSNIVEANVPAQDFIKREFEHSTHPNAEGNGSLNGSGKWYITTAELENYLEDWVKKVQRTSGTSPIEDTATLAAGIVAVLSEAEMLITTLARLVGFNAGSIPPPYRDQLEGVQFYTALLVQGLSTACNRFFGLPDVETTGKCTAPLLEKRMETSGWCPYTTSIVLSLPVDLRVYAFFLGTLRSQLDHDECTPQYCLAHQVEEKKYEVRHLRRGCNCDMIMAPMGKLMQVLQEGKTPLLNINMTYDGSQDGKPTIEVQGRKLDQGVHPAGYIPYIAISHVWADGLGNFRDNALPRCRLIQLSKTLKRVPNEHGVITGSSPAFWMDTLCMPVRGEHRTLQQMHKIYASSYGILVLDPDLSFLPSSASYAEVVTRLILSGWNTRLWTYLEASLAPRLFIQGLNCVFDITNWQERLQLSALQDQPLSHNLARSATLALRTLLPQDISKSLSFASNADTTVQRALRDLSTRSTSLPTDMPLILAALFGLDPTAILASQPTYESRLQALLSLLPTIPPNLLFSVGPRLQTKGFRWAPRSLLQSYGGAAGPVVPSLVPRDFEGRKAVESVGLTERPISYMYPEGNRGLMAYLPSLALSKLDLTREKFLVDVGAGEVYLVSLSPMASSAQTSFSPPSSSQSRSRSFSLTKSTYVVLLAMLFHEETPEFAVQQRGILAEVVGKVRDPGSKGRRLSFRQVAVVESRGPVIVERTSRTGDFGGSVGVEGRGWVGGRLEGGRWWCVD